VVLSHKSAFFSSAMIAIGGYLAVMAAAAFYIRELGGTWGPVVQVLFLFGTMVTGLIVAFAGSSRANHGDPRPDRLQSSPPGFSAHRGQRGGLHRGR
jgi:hypothetical protein